VIFWANFIPKSFPAKNRNPVRIKVGPSGGNYSFGHPAGTVGYCAPEAAEKKNPKSVPCKEKKHISHLGKRNIILGDMLISWRVTK